MPPLSLLAAQDLSCNLGSSSVLRGVNLSVAPGETLAITGASGAGKSTLLFCLSGLLAPSSGDVLFEGTSLFSLTEAQRSSVRRNNFGFVLQFGELIDEITVSENVQLPLRLLGLSKPVAQEKAENLLERLGIADLADRRQVEISGGQAQRVAVARALVHQPKVLFADEPTGALDRDTARLVLDEMFLLAKHQQTAIVIVTHDETVATRADRTLLLVQSRLAHHCPEAP